MKSVDAAKNSVVQNSQEFLRQSNESNASLHQRRESIRFNSLYQSPQLVVAKPGRFLRRNYSEQKGAIHPEFERSARQGYTKPLSLMSSMKKFEVDKEELAIIQGRPKAAKNLMKCKLTR